MASEMTFFTNTDRTIIEERLGFDVPSYVQYFRWMGFIPDKDGKFNGLLQGNLGISLWRNAPVTEEIAARWPITLELGFMALIIAQIIALPIGVFSAIRQDSAGDFAARSFAILCIAVPNFWLGTLVVVMPAIWWGWSPPLMLIRFGDDPVGNIKMFLLPAIVLGMSLSGITMRMTRNMMLEVLRQDYIRTAWSKGLRERAVLIRHALKNALIPVIITVGIQVPLVIGGTVIIERIFALPGMGGLIVDALQTRDYTIVSGVLLIFGAGVAVINLLIDLTYGYVDPRIHYK
ncbi:MAG: ABC transporter permease [Spirochaetales bacterium]|nr:ABC transporter permease [Spirochaetales bacterium]